MGESTAAGYVPEDWSPERPGGPNARDPTWYRPTGPSPWRSPVLLGLIGAVIAINIFLVYVGGPAAVLDGLTLTPLRGGYDDVLVVWGLIIGLPASIVVGALAGTLSKVGVDEQGLTLAYPMHTVRVRWEELRAPLRGFRPGREFVAIRIGWSVASGIAGLWPERTIVVDRETLRMVLSHPGAARSRLGAAYWLDLGLTPP